MLATIEGGEVPAQTVAAFACRTQRISGLRILDLDDISSHVAEHHGAEGAGQNAREIDDANA
jgi:hypothetical protein